MTRMALSGTGLFTPEASISNEELVASFNEYVRRHNAAHAARHRRGQDRAAAGIEQPNSSSRPPASRAATSWTRRACSIPRSCARACPNGRTTSFRSWPRWRSRRRAMRSRPPTATPADIDGVIVAASNMQRAYPAMAVEVQDALGIDGFGFDMNVACSSATFGLQAAADMVAARPCARHPGLQSGDLFRPSELPRPRQPFHLRRRGDRLRRRARRDGARRQHAGRSSRRG